MEEPATEKKVKRPVAVTIAGMLLAVPAAYLIIKGVFELIVWGTGGLERLFSVLSVNVSEGALSLLENLALVDGLFSLLKGIIWLIIVAALLRLRPWSWVFLMAWAGFNLATELIRFIYGRHDYLIMLLLVVAVFLLNLAEVQEAFRLRREVVYDESR